VSIALDPVVVAVLSALCSFVGSYAAVRTEMRYLRRDVDHAHRRLDTVERIAFGRRSFPADDDRECKS
jgi:hypothetical protein